MTFDTLAPMLFQTLCTLALSAVHFGLWRQRRQAFPRHVGRAWAVYALRLIFISAYIETRNLGWLFAHQVVTLGSGLLLLWAALQFATQVRWRAALRAGADPRDRLGVVQRVRDPRHGHRRAVLGPAALHGHTRHRVRIHAPRPRRPPPGRLLSWAFLLWGLHHLDYPVLRAQGSGVLLGVFMDVTLLVLVAVGTLTLVLARSGARSPSARCSWSSSPRYCCARRRRSDVASRANCTTRPGRCSPRSRSSWTRGPEGGQHARGRGAGADPRRERAAAPRARSMTWDSCPRCGR
jgi:hypothetical protein